MKLEMIKVHMEYITLYLFKTEVKKSVYKDNRIKPILNDLYKISALRSLIDDSGSVFESGFLAKVANKRMK